ncbi:DapH/DapD/GlmU-related protein [Loigolactobacillus rennini]|uniref:Acetyltransferase n=1 Tax=Loigolactobacillus rennini DSM 20253 TaxID=1423796 RepID=A0A0R2CSB0_9LACO|nr:DapH/DapD/GlmU-related protein [Loigolactobacillus rennini]KRM94112.1 acetyltransferase [Loigolactobacillus rennini DSM 20253]
MTTAILKQALAGETLQFIDPRFAEITKINQQNSRIRSDLNGHDHTPAEVIQLITQMTKQPVSATNSINPPFYSDFGRHIFMGENIFINQQYFFVDLGGIYIADHVLIGPRVTILTVNHQEQPALRCNVVCKAVHIQQGAWLGANVTILPGVTVGANAIVGAGALVTKDVPANTIVGGVPAKPLRQIKTS